VLRMGLLPPSKQLADECDPELLLEIAISPSFDPTLSYVRSHLVPPKRTRSGRRLGGRTERMISVVGKVMASLAGGAGRRSAAGHAANAGYNKTLTHRPARLISIALRSTGMRSGVN
jgi:hypothetical protein